MDGKSPCDNKVVGKSALVIRIKEGIEIVARDNHNGMTLKVRLSIIFNTIPVTKE
jgi:hypothetical protein